MADQEAAKATEDKFDVEYAKEIAGSFGATAEEVAGALHGSSKKNFTAAEVEKAVKAFRDREVGTRADAEEV